MKTETNPDGIKFDWWPDVKNEHLSIIRFSVYCNPFEFVKFKEWMPTYNPIETKEKKEFITYAMKIKEYFEGKAIDFEISINSLTNDKKKFLEAIYFLQRTKLCNLRINADETKIKRVP